MFDISFAEIVFIGVVALIVIGPQRLPGVARTTGQLLGKLQRYVNDVKADINREIQLEELKSMQDELAQSMSNLESQVNAQLKQTENELNNSLQEQITTTSADADLDTLTEDKQLNSEEKHPEKVTATASVTGNP